MSFQDCTRAISSLIPSVEERARYEKDLARMEAAKKFYAVTPKSPGLYEYLKAVHLFFGLLHDAELGKKGRVFIVLPMEKDQVISLTSYLKWEFVQGINLCDEYIRRVFKEELSAPFSQNLTGLKLKLAPVNLSYEFVGEDVKDERSSPIPQYLTERIEDAMKEVTAKYEVVTHFSSTLTTPFPIYVLASVTSTTLYAVLFCEPTQETDQLIMRMNEARQRYTGLTDFTYAAEYMLKVDNLYKILDSDPVIYSFLPALDKPFDLATFLKLAYVEHKTRDRNYIIDNKMKLITENFKLLIRK